MFHKICWPLWGWVVTLLLPLLTVHNIVLGTHKHVLLRQNSSRLVICCMVMVVLFCRSLSLSTTGWIGTDVKSAVTSYEMIHSPCCSLMPLRCSIKSLMLWTWCVVIPTSGFRILANSLAVLYVTVPVLETMGLRGIPGLWILGSP